MGKHSKIGNYVNSGGFNRLAGRPCTPGSLKPARVFLYWKVLYSLFLGAFMLLGLFFMVF